MPELGSYGSVGAGEGNLSLYPETSKINNQLSSINDDHGRYQLSTGNGEEP
jgi:hypothetical protein